MSLFDFFDQRHLQTCSHHLQFLSFSCSSPQPLNHLLCSFATLGSKRRPGGKGRYRPSRSSWSSRSQGPHRGGWSQGQCCEKQSYLKPLFNTALFYTVQYNATQSTTPVLHCTIHINTVFLYHDTLYCKLNTVTTYLVKIELNLIF